jgi:hypothetical protein
MISPDRWEIGGAARPLFRRRGEIMETRRFDELTVALARGGSRRGVLRSLAGGVVGALALNRGSALAKNDKKGTIEAAPVCDPNNLSPDCPLCAEAKTDKTCCNQRLLGEGKEQACGSAVTDDETGLPLDCTNANLQCDEINTSTKSGGGSCVVATCKEVSGGANGRPTHRCEYRKKEKFCSGTDVCCSTYRSPQFGQCLSNRSAC